MHRTYAPKHFSLSARAVHVHQASEFTICRRHLPTEPILLSLVARIETRCGHGRSSVPWTTKSNIATITDIREGGSVQAQVQVLLGQHKPSAASHPNRPRTPPPPSDLGAAPLWPPGRPRRHAPELVGEPQNCRFLRTKVLLFLYEKNPVKDVCVRALMHSGLQKCSA